jgi:hypothetical protein
VHVRAHAGRDAARRNAVAQEFYVETYRPAYPDGGIHVRVHTGRDYGTDYLSPGMTSVWHVRHVRTKEAAIAAVIERAAGKNVTVSQVF